MDPKLLEKFFKNTCTAEEAKRVLKWFSTKEGRAYLEESFDDDIQLLKNKQITPLLPDIDEQDVWKNIDEGIEAKKWEKRFPKKTFPYWKAVAAVLIAAFSSVWLVLHWMDIPSPEGAKKNHPAHYMAGINQQKVLTLQDGTKIRLNENAQIWISANFGQSSREIKLDGEAYFEVVHNDAKPFIIHTSGVSIEDLGTAFDVRSMPEKQNVQVAVAKGKVSVWSDKQTEKEATKLVGGQYAYVDLKTHEIEIDSMGIRNYLSWMTGRLVFNRMSLDKVSTQLGRIYGVSFAYQDDSLKQLSLTTDFERKSLTKVLEVISLTLHIDYKRKGGKIIWIRQESDSK